MMTTGPLQPNFRSIDTCRSTPRSAQTQYLHRMTLQKATANQPAQSRNYLPALPPNRNNDDSASSSDESVGSLTSKARYFTP